MTDADNDKIVAAIQLAEDKTSGEIRVHINKKLNGSSALDDAKEMFHKLEMYRTQKRNAVLIYLATEDRQFAILGDKGINEVVPSNFWEDTIVGMKYHLSKNELLEAILYGVEMAGNQLKRYFPIQENDKDELTNEVTHG